MSKFWVVMFHTYKTRLRSKPFLISTIITVVLLFALTNMDQIIKLFNGGGAQKIGVIDTSGEYFPLISAQLKPSADEVKVSRLSGDEKSADQEVKKGNLDGYILIKKNREGLPDAVYKAQDTTKQQAADTMKNALQQVKNMEAVKKLGLTPAAVGEIYSPIAFQKISLSTTAKSEEETAQAYILVYIMLFFMYMSVMMYGSMIAVEVATEKSSRVMEILISSISPVKQMFGKILGIVLIALTQLAIFTAAAYASIQMNQKISGSASIIQQLKLNKVPISLIIYAILFFILGFFMYATLFAMIGSLISRVEETNSVMTPLMMVIVAAFMLAMFGRENPDSAVITVISYIPLFTPMLMLLRVGMLTIPVWEVAISMGLLVLTILLFAVIGARVYRGGVLLYGNSPSIKLIKQAMLLSKQEKKKTPSV